MAILGRSSWLSNNIMKKLKGIKKIVSDIKSFLNDTKLGHFIKSSVITFTGIYLGILGLNPLINELLKTDLPTINQLNNIWPVLVDAFYRAIWAMILVQIGVYKYNSSQDEANKSLIIPNKKGDTSAGK